ncbi:MAG: hypothetical protein EB060_04550 [Proteobacteria bacterium]|nr:hypothetical protein [Pseudomonadota bacterium]
MFKTVYTAIAILTLTVTGVVHAAPGSNTSPPKPQTGTETVPWETGKLKIGQPGPGTATEDELKCIATGLRSNIKVRCDQITDKSEVIQFKDRFSCACKPPIDGSQTFWYEQAEATPVDNWSTLPWQDTAKKCPKGDIYIDIDCRNDVTKKTKDGVEYKACQCNLVEARKEKKVFPPAVPPTVKPAKPPTVKPKPKKTSYFENQTISDDTVTDTETDTTTDTNTPVSTDTLSPETNLQTQTNLQH